jgi:hypothetical protein
MDVLTTVRMSEAKLRDRVAEITGIQADLESPSMENADVRARRLQSYVQSDLLPARQFALEALGKLGPSATATIRGMLDDTAFALHADELIKAYVTAGRETVREDLNIRLRNELEFWRAKGPALPKGWWNQIETPGLDLLRSRYLRTFQLVLALQRVHYSEAATTARELSVFWKSLPQLNDPSGINQMANECDKLIDQLSVSHFR